MDWIVTQRGKWWEDKMAAPIMLMLYARAIIINTTMRGTFVMAISGYNNDNFLRINYWK